MSASSSLKGKQALLEWCRLQTQGYPNVNVRNMKTSWRDGLALCALIHHFRPDLIDFDSLDEKDIVKNNELAFRTAEKELGIPALLDVSDLVELDEPEELSVVTYVSLYYHHFKDKRPKEGNDKKNVPARPKRYLFEILLDESAGTFRRRKLRSRGSTSSTSEESAECNTKSSTTGTDEIAEGPNKTSGRNSECNTKISTKISEEQAEKPSNTNVEDPECATNTSTTGTDEKAEANGTSGGNPECNTKISTEINEEQAEKPSNTNVEDPECVMHTSTTSTEGKAGEPTKTSEKCSEWMSTSESTNEDPEEPNKAYEENLECNEHQPEQTNSTSEGNPDSKTNTSRTINGEQNGESALTEEGKPE